MSAPDADDLTAKLRDITKLWTSYDDVPRSSQRECREIGKQLHAIGGYAAMHSAYYDVTGQNRAATVLAAYWDNIGEWRW